MSFLICLRVVRRHCVSVPLTGILSVIIAHLPARAVCFVVDRLLWMADARARIIGSDGTLGAASGAVDGDAGVDALAPYSDDDVRWDFVDVLVNAHIEVRAILRQDFDSFRELCHSANVLVSEDSNETFSLALHNLNAVPNYDSAMSIRVLVLE